MRLRIDGTTEESFRASEENLGEIEARTRMCVHGLNFDEIVEREDALLSPRDRAFRRILAKAEASYSSLTEPERLWLTVNALLISIRNGGLISYYYNPYADRLADCMEARETLDAQDMLALVRHVNSGFGERVPETVKERNAAIESWPDFVDTPVTEREQVAADRLIEMLSAYIAENGLVTPTDSGGP